MALILTLIRQFLFPFPVPTTEENHISLERAVTLISCARSTLLIPLTPKLMLYAVC